MEEEMSTYKPKNILITGAAGFIASHVANSLTLNHPEYNIVVLDKLDYCSNLKNITPSISYPNFKFVKGDITSSYLVKVILIDENIDTILHFAAQTNGENSIEFTFNNIYGTHTLLEVSRVTGQIRRFIHVSTDDVYGESNGDFAVGNHKEASQLLPYNPYSATKAGAEMLVMSYRRSYGLPVIITRRNNAYGPNQFPEKLIPKFMLLAMRGEPLPVHGDGSNVRSYLYYEDVCEAFEVILHRGQVGHVYNIGTKKERRVIDIAKDICKLFSLDPDSVIKFVENRPFNDQRYLLDDQKLKKLGWSERTTWEEGLKKTMKWYKSNPEWWGDVSGALLPHSMMQVKPGFGERFDGSEAMADMFSQLSVKQPTTENKMVIPVAKKPSSLKFLIYGKTGLIGGLLGKICEKQGIPYEYGNGCLEYCSQILLDIQNVKPTHVLNATGEIDKPDVNWYRSQKLETVVTYFVGILNLAEACKEHGLLLMNYARYAFDKDDSSLPEGSGIGLKEEDGPYSPDSCYYRTKAEVEELLKAYDNVCTLIMGIPISSDLSNLSDFVSKISSSSEGEHLKFSMTVLDELLPKSVEMVKRNRKGVYHFINPGVVSSKDFLEMYESSILLSCCSR